MMSQDLCSKNRNQDIVTVRHIAMFLIKKMTGQSLRDIGLFLGNRDHATVKYGIEKIASLIKTDAILAKNIKQIEQDLLS